MKDIFSLFPKLVAVWGLALWLILVLPCRQMGSQQPVVSEESGSPTQVYPVFVEGITAVGKDLFLSEGCHVCHTQVVRGPGRSDIVRGWGNRRSVSRDFLFEIGVPIGWYRIGPDLSNVGSSFWRNESKDDYLTEDRSDVSWMYAALIRGGARLSSSGHSSMPSYSRLFNVVDRVSASELSKRIGRRLSDGLFYEPSAEAVALVAYMSSLQRDFPLEEAGPSTSVKGGAGR
jgi:cytochrome c oxidase cbb3-type subunit 2